VLAARGRGGVWAWLDLGVNLGAEGGWGLWWCLRWGLRGRGGGQGGDVVVELLSAAPRPNPKEQKKLVRENGPRTSYNGRTELIRGIHVDRIMKA
jgi:hypothetical protein